MNQKSIAIIGSGFSGLASAAYLAKAGCEVHIYEKNSQFGGRARQFETKGFTFDMGPSWYWMPDVMESFFNDFGKEINDYFLLKRLDPAFDIVFGEGDNMEVPNDYADLKDLFNLIEPGSGVELDNFMQDAQEKYDISFSKLIERPGLSILEYLELDIIKKALKQNLFSSYQKMVHSKFKHPKLRALMEFPVLFLGAKPKDTPALYSLMNYAGLKLGTHYPMGGFKSLVNAMVDLCEGMGVVFHSNAEIKKINVENGKVVSVSVLEENIPVDAVIGSADYHHIESRLLSPIYRNYNETYWSKKTFAPSSLIFYIGVNKQLDRLMHHTLFFDANFDQHSSEIYDNKKWPTDPLFYVCTPSKTDPKVAPFQCENLFVLMPLATGLQDSDGLRAKYFQKILSRLELYLGEQISDNIVVNESYCIRDFQQDYNAFGGNAYGLANTLSQTAIFKPKMINKKISNLIYTGQLTVPGPGVPPSIISGKIAANLLIKQLEIS